jgi:hypothetical protein
MSIRTALMEMANNQLDENKNIIKLYQDMKAQGKKDHNILDYIGSMPKYKRMTRDQIAKIIGDAKRKGIFEESVELDEAKEVLSNFMNDRKKEQTISLAKQKGLKVKDMGDKIEVSGPKGKVADMIAIHKPVYVRERAAWVPESIADEQVEAFMEATLAAVTEGADTFVFEGKHYKAKSKAEAKKLDPVGQADADIDNDGDVDSSDDYLKNRRKTIKKSMKDDDDDEVNEIDGAASGMRAADKEPTVNLKALKKRRAAEKARKTARPDPLRNAKPMKFESTETIDEAMSGTYMTVDYDYSDNFGILELFKNGKKIGSWDGYPSSESGKNYLAIEATKLAKKHGVNPRGLMTVDAENEKRKGKLVPNKDFGFPVNRKESVEEAKAPGATAQHGVDANTQDTFEKQLSTRKGEKDFVDQHSMEVGMDIEKITAENKKSIEDALKVTPPRMGDQKAGGNSFVSPIQSNIIDGITKALQQMKTNN